MYASGLWIFSISLFVATFVALILIAKLLTKPIDNYKFSSMRIFPFEVPLNLDRYDFIYKTILFLNVGLSFSPLFSMLDTTSKLESISGFSIAIVCLFGIAGICFTFLHYFDVTHVKAHLTLFGIFVCLVLMANILTCSRGIIAYKTYLDHSSNFIILLISGILSGICALFSIFIALNPRLLNWARLDKVEGKENEYVRPKKFPLAYSEWAVFLMLNIGVVSYFLQLLVQ